VADKALGALPKGTVIDLRQQKGNPRPAALKLVPSQAFSNLEPRELDALG